MNGKGEPERYAGLVSPFDDGTIRGGSADLGTAGALFGHLAMRQHFQIKGLSILCWAVLVVCYLRIFSRNIYARQQENQKLLQFWWKLKNGRANRPSREERKKYKVFICPTCKQKLRVPRGKGKISISCPKCGTNFIKKT